MLILHFYTHWCCWRNYYWSYSPWNYLFCNCAYTFKNGYYSCSYCNILNNISVGMYFFSDRNCRTNRGICCFSFLLLSGTKIIGKWSPIFILLLFTKVLKYCPWNRFSDLGTCITEALDPPSSVCGYSFRSTCEEEDIPLAFNAAVLLIAAFVLLES